MPRQDTGGGGREGDYLPPWGFRRGHCQGDRLVVRPEVGDAQASWLTWPQSAQEPEVDLGGEFAALPREGRIQETGCVLAA